jgi:erythritol transport system substrate-binding protein
LSKNPDVQGVIAGNDEMALGAINALKDKGKLKNVKVLGFDGNQDAVNAVENGEMVASVLQPIVEGTKKAAGQLDSVIRTGQTGVPDEKQALDCTLITKDNADQVNNFVLSGG